MKLIVIHEFAEYKKGDEITDAKTIALIVASEQSAHVHKVAVEKPAKPVK